MSRTKVFKNAMEKFEISRDEGVIIGSILTFALLFIAFLPRIMKSQLFTNLAPPLQYLIFNTGFILFTVVIFGVPLSYVLKRDIHMGTMLRSGLSSWLVFSFILDMWQPPFAVSPSSGYLITSQESLVGTSVDYMVSWVYARLLPVDGAVLAVPFVGNLSVLFVLTYIITPLLATFLIALMLKPKAFARMLEDRI